MVIVGMARRVERSKLNRSKRDCAPLADLEIDKFGATGFREPCPRTGQCAKSSGAGHVIGMDVGFNRAGEAEPELPEQVKIALDGLKNRVDQCCLASLLTCEEIGVGRGTRLEQ